MIFVLTGLVVALGLVLCMVIWKGKPETVYRCQGADWGTGADEGIATPCGQRLKRRNVHKVYSGIELNPKFGGGGAMVGEFCSKHCPGDCSNPRCRLVRAHGS